MNRSSGMRRLEGRNLLKWRPRRPDEPRVTRLSLRPRSTRSASRLLEAALAANVVVHAVAIVGTVFLLWSGLPGSPADGAERIAYLVEHTRAWRWGWFAWALVAAANVLLGVALVRTAWVPRRPARITLAITIAAAVPDVVGQILWTTWGVGLAAAATDANPAGYVAFETYVRLAVCVVAGFGYLLAGLGWSWCFRSAGVWSRRLTWLTLATWGMFAAAIGFYFLSRPWMAVFNAFGFVLLVGWLIAVTDRVVARCRPDEATGRYAPWRHPIGRYLGAVIDRVANSRFVRILGEWLPTSPLASDVRDVVYVNYLVDAERLEPLVPEGFELQRVGPDGRHALFTIVTYRNGHVGPPWLGPLRQHLPSPVQSDWRIYVADPKGGNRGVCVVTSTISSTPYALGGRMLSDVAAMHVPQHTNLVRDASGTIHLSLYPGGGSAPDVLATLRPSLEHSLPADWLACFGDWREFLGYCLPQDSAMSFQPWYDRVTRRTFELSVSPNDCRRLDGTVESRAAAALLGDATPLCFHVPFAKLRIGRAVFGGGVTPPAKPAAAPVPPAAAAA